MARPALTTEALDAFRARAAAVAMELFGTDGYEHFSMRTLAKALGCSHATPYRYFPGGKEEIFAEVRAEGFRRFAAALRASHGADAEAAMRDMARAYVHFAGEERAAFAVIFEMGQANHGYPVVDDAALDAWSVLLEAVQHALDAGVIAGEPLAVAHTLWAGLHGVACLESAGKLRMGHDAPDVLHLMVEALLRAHRPSESRHG